MRVARVVCDSVWVCEFEPVQVGERTLARITSMRRTREGTKPRPGDLVFHQIEESRAAGRVCVALVIGPATEELLPDWSRSGFLAILNPASAYQYGGFSPNKRKSIP